ncbi:MAG: heme o synthase [Bacteroidetes bacterium]|nr:heme o synthase [Bacteroidota bacterium]
MENQPEISKVDFYTSKAGIKDYLILGKYRLSLLVAITACIGYIVGVYKDPYLEFNIASLILLLIGGFLLSAASNALNQVMEKDSDKLMTRTQSRPLVTNIISVNEAVVFAFISAIVSIFILGITFNATVAFLGLGSLVIYAFVYTPLKKISPICAFVGALPGAAPPMLGFIGATGEITFIAMVIFAIQFFWQFVHFWSLAWLLHEDYLKAGYFMLPSRQGKSKHSAFQIWWYSLLMTITSAIPFIIGYSGVLYLIVAMICGAIVLWYSLQLYKTLENKEAKKVMLSSYVHIVFVLIALLF